MAIQTVTYDTAGTYNINLPTNVKSLTYEIRGASGGGTGPGVVISQGFTPGAQIDGGPGERITGEFSASAVSGKTLVVVIGTKGFDGTTNFGSDGAASGGTGSFNGGAGGTQPGGEVICNSGGGAGGGSATTVSIDNGYVLIAGGGGGAGGATYDQWDSQYREPNGSAVTPGTVGTTLNASSGQAGGNGNINANAGSGGGGGGNNGNNYNDGGSGGIAVAQGNHIGGNHGQKGGSYRDTNFVINASTVTNAFRDNDGFFELTYETGDPPTVQFNVSPAAVIVNGTGATLEWAATGDAASAPTSVTINGQAVAFTGTLAVSPTSTTIYTLVAEGPGGVTTDSITLTVVPQGNSLTNEFVTTYGTGSHTIFVPAGTTNAFVTIAAGRGGSGGSDANGSGCPGGAGRVGQFRLNDNGAGNPYGAGGSVNQTIYQDTTVAVPANIDTLNYEIQGGKGGDTAAFTTGHLGQKITGVLTNIAGQTLSIKVGGNGGAGNSAIDLGSPGQGYNDGGSGGLGATVSSTYITVPLYRYFNSTTGDHFTGLSATPPTGYALEGQIANVFTDPQPPGTIAISDNEPGKPASTYTAYAFPPAGTPPFFIDVTEIATTLFYAKTNGTDVLWTSNATEGNANGYTLDTTNNAFGYVFYAPTSPVNLSVDGNTGTRGGGGGGSSAIHIGNTTLVVAGGGGGAGGVDACGTLNQTGGQDNGILYTTGARTDGLDGSDAQTNGGGGGGGGAGGGWTPTNLPGDGGGPCEGGTGGKTGNGYYNLAYSQNAGVLSQGDNFNSGNGYVKLTGAGQNDWNLILRIGNQGDNGASGSPGGKPGGQGGTGAAGFMDGGGGGSDSLGGGWSGSGAGGGAGSGIYDTDNQRWFAAGGGGGGGGGGSWNRSCSGSGGTGGSWSATTNVNNADGGAGANAGGDGGGGGGGGGGHSGGGGGGAGVDNNFGGSSGGGGTSRYDDNALELIQGGSTNTASGYAILSFTVPPSVQYFRANDDSPTTDAYEGDPVILSWSTFFNGVETASFAEIDNGIGEVNVGDGQTYTITAPSSTTTYTMTVSNAGVFSQRAVTVNVLAPDNIPDIFTFDSIFDADISTNYLSNEATITGIQVPVNASASNGAFISVNGGAFSQNVQIVENGDTVQVRMESSGSYTSQKTSTVTIGLTVATWSITTISEPGQFPNAFEFENVLDAPTSTYVESNEITITGITVPVLVSSPTNGFESSVNGSAYSTAQKVINNGEVLKLRVLTSGNLGETVGTTITVGDSPNKSWNVTNVATADQDPDYFDFVNVVGATANTMTESLPQVIGGINVPTPVTLTGGAEFRVGTGAWQTSGNINVNDSVQLRVTSSPDYGGEVEVDVTIGTLTDVWKVITTTDGDQIPDAFYFINQTNQAPNTFVYSNTVLVQGLTAAANITVTGGNFKVGNGGWVTSGQINNGETLRLRILTPNGLSQTGSMSITVGP